MPTLLVVIASTRPGRIGPAVAAWFTEHAAAHGGFDLDVADLAELALPMMDEPHHPRLGRYEHDHTRAWSAQVDAADAVVLVMPEYNHSFTAPLKNAIDYLAAEWADKPIGYVSYGGLSGGVRAVQAIKPVLSAVGAYPVAVGVHLPFVHAMLDADGRLVPADHAEHAADALLAELGRRQEALAPLRACRATT